MHETQPMRVLLAEYAELLNQCGVDSQEAKAFLEANSGDAEFYELAMLSRTLKQALTAPACGCGASCN